MDKFEAMRVYTAVVKTGSFTRAAEAMRLPKASVTMRIQSLEAHLGVKLLQRSTRAVRVTDDGRAYYEQCVRLLNDLEDVEQSLHAAQVTPRGKLRVDMPAAVARFIVAPSLSDFHAQFPEVELRIGSTDRTIDLLEEGVDCVIRAGKLQDSGLIAHTVALATMGVFAAPAYIQRHGTPRHPHELETHACIAFFQARTGAVPKWDFARNGEQINIQPHPHFQFSDGQSVTAAGLAGQGIFEAPVFSIATELQSGALQVVLPDWQRARVPVSIVYPQNRHLSARVRCFVDWVSKRLANDPYLTRQAIELVAKRPIEDGSETQTAASIVPAGVRAGASDNVHRY